HRGLRAVELFRVVPGGGLEGLDEADALAALRDGVDAAVRGAEGEPGAGRARGRRAPGAPWGPGWCPASRERR
ncbi:hypothetical protein, partial [Streptomyces sp. CC77]|uniref:hypothetical protein n=1 Tax=Streptomyces sp. CC77 TaxID=1906739 RepID=UPI001C3162B5